MHTMGWNVSWIMWWTLQVVGFILSSNLAAEGFTFWSRYSAINKREQFTGNGSRILGAPAYYFEGFVAVAGTLIVTLAVHVVAGNILLTLLVLIGLTNAAYVIWGYLSYKELEDMSLELKAAVDTRARSILDADTSPNQDTTQIQHITFPEDLDG